MANRITRHIPNAITSCNLFSGCVAAVMAFEGQPRAAFLFIVIGALFDFFDGLSARALKVSSPIGKELDSLADNITFGLAPALMLFSWMRELPYPALLGAAATVLPYCAFLIAVFSALRLAKFNLDERQATSFIGLPTPANALFWASLCTGAADWIDSLYCEWLLLPGLVVVSCYLLVAEIPMFSLKFKRMDWQSAKWQYILIAGAALILVVAGWAGFALVIVWYIALAILKNLLG